MFSIEVALQQRELEQTHAENIKYLKTIPKNPLEGFVCAGKAIGQSIFFGFACLLAGPFVAVDNIWSSPNSKDVSVGAKIGKTVVLTPLALVGGALVGTGNILAGIGSGVTSVGHGIKNALTKNTVDKQIDNLQNEKKEKESNIIDNVLNDNKVHFNRLPFTQQLYGRILRNGFFGDIE